MNKLPRDIKPQKLLKALIRLGFNKVAGRGSHTKLVHPDGRWTQVAAHPKPIPQGTLRAILKQADLTKEEFLQLLKKK